VARNGGFLQRDAAQTGLEIDFEHTDVPRSLPQDILFASSVYCRKGLRKCRQNTAAAQHFKVELPGTPGAIRSSFAIPDWV